MKALPTPPLAVIFVGKVLFYLLKKEKIDVHKVQNKDPEWPKIQAMMAKPKNFLEEVKAWSKVEATKIPPEKKAVVKKFLADPEFQPAFVAGKAAAAGALCDWTHNIIEFNEKYLYVAPLEEKKNAAIAEANQKQKELAEVQANLAKIQDALAILQAELDEAEEKKREVEEKKRINEEKSRIAQELVDGLASNQIRWIEKKSKLETETLTVIGDTLIAAEFVSYIGAFSKSFREEILKNKWLPDIEARKIPCTENVDPLDILCTNSQVAKWKNERLPEDRMSVENAAIVVSCSRWPLIIDP